MLLTDVNVLIYAFRPEAVDHSRYKAWLDDVMNGDEPYGVSELALSGFLRIVTHPNIFVPPYALEAALDFVGVLRNQPNCVVQRPVPGIGISSLAFAEESRRRGSLFQTPTWPRWPSSREVSGLPPIGTFVSSPAIGGGIHSAKSSRNYSGGRNYLPPL